MEWLQTINRELFFSLWLSNLNNKKLCERMQLNPSRLWKASKHFNFPTRVQAAIGADDPTLEEIEHACAIVRESWSLEEEERRRVGCRPRPWQPYYV